MKVRIAFVTKPGSDEIDTDRIGAIEEHSDEDAKRLIREGVAAKATDAEIADYATLLEHRQVVEQIESAAKADPSHASRRATAAKTAEPATTAESTDAPA